MNKLEKEQYFKLTKFKDALFLPLIKILSLLKVKPTAITYTRVFLMVLFVALIKISDYWPLFLLIFSYFLDNLDGSLARFTKTASDKGKFKDIVCDNLSFILFIIGLIYAGYLTGLAGMIFVYLMLTSLIFRIIYNARLLKSDWLFKSVAGFLPNILAGLFYIAFLIFVLSKLNYFLEISIIFSIILLIDSVVFYFKILKQKK